MIERGRFARKNADGREADRRFANRCTGRFRSSLQHFGGLYVICVRGLAHLAARQPAEAAAEFQRILDHRSIVIVDPMDALARLQLARALALSGDTVKAKRTYDDLFALWKDADPDLPILKEARAEHARLP